MTNILFISSALNRAGTETFMMNVFHNLPQDRFHVDFLIFTKEETDYSHEIEQAGCRVWHLVSRRDGKLYYFRQLNKFFREHAMDYHAIHWCGMSLSSIAPIYYAWKYNIPIRIVHAHGSYTNGLHNRILHNVFRIVASHISTHHLACSSSAAKWFFGNAKDTIIIKNGIDLGKYTYNVSVRETTRKRLNIPKDTLVIGHVGRFCIEKNHAYLLKIFSEVLALRPNSILMLIGKGELESGIKTKAKAMGIDSHILFMGERTDVPQLMQAMDCFVLPSLFEGLPFVLVEAQATGLPCFVSDGVNKDVAITPNIEFISIHNDVASWVKKIYNSYLSYIRTDCSSDIYKAGYSITTSIQTLENIYNYQ